MTVLAALVLASFHLASSLIIIPGSGAGRIYVYGDGRCLATIDSKLELFIVAHE